MTWEQVLTAYVALAGWLCLMSNGALLCSVVSASSGRAVALVTGLMVLFFASAPMLQSMAATRPASWLPFWFNQPTTTRLGWQQTLSVLPRLDEALAPKSPSTFAGPQFWWSVAGGAVCFGLSVVLFNRCASPDTPSAVVRSQTVRRLAVGRAWKLAIAWKDFLFFTGGAPMLLVRGLLYALVTGAFLLVHQVTHPSSTLWLSDDLAWFCFLVFVGIVTVEALFYATGLLMQELDSGTLGPLRLVPSSTAGVMLQKLAACLIALLPGMLTIAAVLGLNGGAISARTEPAMVIWYVFELMLCLHLTLLFSMRTRWAALPIALFLTAASNLCTPLIFLSLIRMSSAVARLNGIEIGGLVGPFINMVWGWLFVLFPLELEIVNSWNRTAAK